MAPELELLNLIRKLEARVKHLEKLLNISCEPIQIIHQYGGDFNDNQPLSAA
jgi:hypothetical protein